MATSYPFLSLARSFHSDYGAVLRHAEWFRSPGHADEPASALTVECKLSIEREVRTPIGERGLTLPSIAA